MNLTELSYLVGQMVKNSPAMQETQVQTLGREDPLEKRMATHSSIPLWRIPWTEELGRLQFMESQRVRHDRVTKHTHSHLITPQKLTRQFYHLLMTTA